MFVVWLLQHPQNKIVLKKIVILPHTKKRAWVAVDELVPLLKALTTANRQKRATQKPTLNMLIPTLSPHITHGKAGIQ